jgi:peptide chain release factor subunit 3
MSKLNPSAFSFVPGQRFTLPQQVQQPLQPVERPEQSDPPLPPPTISLNIGTPNPPVSAPPPAKKEDAPKSSIKFQKADSSATSKTFTTEKAKTDTNTIAQDVKNAADQAVLEDLFGSSVFRHFVSMYLH